MKRLHESGILSTFGGFCALAVVMGIGRFAYTALLPGMMESYGLSEKTAGALAAWNYAGYLAGVLAMRKARPGQRRYIHLIVSLAVSVITTAAMGVTVHVPAWHALRLLSGFASGACFVLCSSIVLDTLAAINRPVLAGLLYSGVGVGIALGGLAAGPLESLGGTRAAWFGMAALCLPLTGAAMLFLRPSVNRTLPLQEADAVTQAAKRGYSPVYLLLLATYFLEGFGYIIGTTFLVALVRDGAGSPELAGMSWIITGCAAALSAPLWRYAARGGYLPMLVLAFLMQAAGVLLPVVSASPVPVCLGGLLLGGTFMGITVLSLQYGVMLSCRPSAHTVAVMTAVYGIGQILGPFVAGLTAEGQGFSFAFILSSVSLFLATGLLGIAILGKKR